MIDRLPVEQIPEFNEYVRKLAYTLLNQTDGWASQRQVPKASSRGDDWRGSASRSSPTLRLENAHRRRKPT